MKSVIHNNKTYRKLKFPGWDRNGSDSLEGIGEEGGTPTKAWYVIGTAQEEDGLLVCEVGLAPIFQEQLRDQVGVSVSESIQLSDADSFHCMLKPQETDLKILLLLNVN